MCGFVCTNKDLEYSKSNKKIKSRGPDFTNSVKLDKFNIVHNLLDISGLKILQPITRDNVTIFFNGEIYEPYNEIESKTIIPLYKEYGEKFIEKINGEYALVIIDHSKELILAYSDIFATKPLYYSINDNNIGISSYESELHNLNFKDIKRVNSSTYIKINLKNNSYKITDHNNFNLDDNITNFDSCIESLNNAFEYRCNKKAGIGLSSGYDSGSILKYYLNTGNKKGTFYYVDTNNEDENIIKDRINLCKDNKLKYRIINYKKPINKLLYDNMEKKYLESNMEKYNFYLNEGSTLLYSKIFQLMKKDNLNIFISGQGGDEILSNSDHNGNFSFKNLKNKFPWKHFFNGDNREFIDQQEYIGGSYGIEVRYPFLDKKFVQSFLNLTPKLKNMYYKSPLNVFLENIDAIRGRGFIENV